MLIIHLNFGLVYLFIRQHIPPGSTQLQRNDSPHGAGEGKNAAHFSKMYQDHLECCFNPSMPFRDPDAHQPAR